MAMDTVVSQGYLQKRGAVVKSWKNRFFVLKRIVTLISDSETVISHSLSYYKSEPENSKIRPISTVDLNEAVAVSQGLEPNASPWSIDIVTPKRIWALAAENGVERDKWLSALSEAIPNAGSSFDIVREGALLYQVGILREVWSERYFGLGCGFLFIFERKLDFQRFQRIAAHSEEMFQLGIEQCEAFESLEDATVEKDIQFDIEHVFSLTCKSRQYHLRGNTELAMDNWILEIREQTKLWSVRDKIMSSNEIVLQTGKGIVDEEIHNIWLEELADGVTLHGCINEGETVLGLLKLDLKGMKLQWCTSVMNLPDIENVQNESDTSFSIRNNRNIFHLVAASTEIRNLQVDNLREIAVRWKGCSTKSNMLINL
eukprot:167681_1